MGNIHLKGIIKTYIKGKLELFDFKNSPKDIKLIHSLNKEGYSD